MTNATNPNKRRNYPAILVVGCIIVLILVTFAIQNADNVPIEYFKLKTEVSLSLLIFFCIFGGVLIGIIFSAPGLFKHKKNAKILAKELRSTREKLSQANDIQETNEE